MELSVVCFLIMMNECRNIYHNHQRSCFIRHVRQVEPKFPGTRQWGHQVVREGERRGHMLHVTCHPSQTWDIFSCFPVLRGAQQRQLCYCQYVSIIYSLKLYYFRLVPLIYDVKKWACRIDCIFSEYIGLLGSGQGMRTPIPGMRTPTSVEPVISSHDR